MIQFIIGVVAFVCAALLAYSITPSVRVLAYKMGAVDVPLDGRRVHKKPIPRIGGLAIYLSFIITTALFCDISRDLVMIWVGGGILVITGVFDDIFRLNAWLKLAIQFLVAGFAVWNGCIIDFVNVGGYISLGVFSIPITIFWLVGLTNAINFIDGLDGLACGVSAISAMSLLCVVLIQGDFVSTLICAVLLGSCLGFLPFNSNPARIFMGDTGALFLGYTLAVLSVQGVYKMHAVLSFIVPIAIFALPIFDALSAIIRRIIKGKSPFSPDRDHIHHKLIDMGFTQKESVKILYAICGILGLVAVFCTDMMGADTKIVKAIAIAVIAILILLINVKIMTNPNTRRHSGLTADEMTVDEYMSELDPEKAKKIEIHNGGGQAVNTDLEVEAESSDESAD